MKPRYSVFALARNALNYHKDWEKAWRSPAPRPEYDAVIVGAGGHGLATAYYLAKNHKMTNIAVVEKGWLGGGNTGRNTTIIRSNYLQDPSIAIYELARSLYEDLSQDLNFNIMFSPRGVMMLCQTEHEFRAFKRTAHANRLAGLDCRMITPAEVKEIVPIINDDPSCRYPILGAYYQPRGGTGRHDAVAWGYARGADALGVDIIQNCEVTGIRVEKGRVTGVETNRGFIGCRKLGLAAAGNSSEVAAMAGMRLPVESHVLQAFVSEGLKPYIDGVITFGAGHFYVSQSDKGGLVFGGDLDGYNSYARRGNLPMVEHVIEAGVAMIPGLARVRVLRSWGGIMDMSMDGSPIIDKTHIDGLYLNTGWCYGGFKATPASGWCFAWTIAKNERHKLNDAYRLDRFRRGYMIDEKGQGATPNLH